MGFKWLAAVAAVVLFTTVPARAGEAELTAGLAKLTERLAAQEQRLAGLEMELVKAKAALTRDLAQPMLLLVGDGPCPYGFERIVTRVMILTRTRKPENGHLFDAAGLTGEDPPGVGDNVYRDLDFCFRRANAVGIE